MSVNVLSRVYFNAIRIGAENVETAGVKTTKKWRLGKNDRKEAARDRKTSSTGSEFEHSRDEPVLAAVLNLHWIALRISR
jgi:hypothetical protein